MFVFKTKNLRKKIVKLKNFSTFNVYLKNKIRRKLAQILVQLQTKVTLYKNIPSGIDK